MQTFISFGPASSGIPAVIWSGVIGAVIALVGVIANNWLTARSQAKEKYLDRTMGLRKDVYLPLAAAMQESQIFLGALASAKPGEMGVMKEFAVAIAKVQLVAEVPTAMVAMQVSAELAIAYMELLGAAQPAIAATADAELAKEYRVAAQENVKIAGLEMDKFLRSAKIDDSVFGAIQRNLTGYRREVQEHMDKESAAAQSFAQHSLEYSRLILEKMPALGALSTSLLVAIRKDLGQTEDEAAFVLNQQENQKKVIRAARKALKDLEASQDAPGQ